ncbi:MAG: hypothetical protein R3F02_01645 [Thiolinea sp.]
MPATLNLSLTDELRKFVDANCGDGTDFATPSEFLRNLIREKKQRQEAAELRAAILEGYQDMAAGRVIRYQGNLRQTLAAAKEAEQKGWK